MEVFICCLEGHIMADRWFYGRGGQRNGPVTFEQLRQLVAGAQLRPDDLVWQDGWSEWRKATEVTGLFAAPQQPPSGPSPSSPSKPPSSSSPPPGTIGPESPVSGLVSWFTGLSTAGKAAAIGGASFLGFSILCCGCMGLLGLGGSGGTGETPQTRSTASTSGHVEAGTPSKAKPSASSKDGPGINDEFQLGDYKYRITGAQQQGYVGNEFMNERASAGATFLIVSYTIENCTNETQTVLAEDFKLLDSKGREFRPSSDVNTALLAEGDKDFLVSELQPGIPRRMKVGFEVPNSIPISDFTLLVPEKGLFSSGKVRIRLMGQ